MLRDLTTVADVGRYRPAVSRDMNDLKLRRYIISYLRKLSIENEWMLIVVCHPLPPTQRFLETQFWRHAITSEGVVTIAPSVLRALRVNSGNMVSRRYWKYILFLKSRYH